jgi:outer membrane murein-binding lipoprotein Lpp
MRIRHSVVLFTLLVAGCAGPSAQEKYDTAERDLERAQQRLDNLRPAYDTARAAAINAVCQEIAGTTPDDAASAALAGLGDVLNGTTAPPVVDAGAPPAEKNAGKKKDELDTVVDNLAAAQKDFSEKQAALTAPVAKAREVMAKIKTPGTPEAKLLEEKMKSMSEVQAYERQQKRVEKAQQAVDEAKSKLEE